MCILLSKKSVPLKSKSNPLTFFILFFIAFHSDNKSYGRAVKAKGLAQTVLKISLIGEVEEIGIVTEDNEGRRSYRYLRHIVDLESLALVGRRLGLCGGIVEHVVEHTCRDTHGRLVMDIVDVLEQLGYTLTGECRYEYQRCVGHV